MRTFGKSLFAVTIFMTSLSGCTATVDHSGANATGSGATPGQGGGATNGTGGAPTGSAGSGVTPGGTGGGFVGGTGGTGGPTGPIGIGGGTPPGPAVLDAGRTVLRRLNRTEYNNTVRDLLGTTLTPGERFPGDDISVEGFDTVGLSLNFTSLHAEHMETAANELVAELFAKPATNPARMRILVCVPAAANADACTRQVLTPFMRRAYRRPVPMDEVEDLVRLAAEIRTAGGTPEDGLRAALRVVLMSPHFLYRVELNPAPTLTPQRLTPHELATRLSYFAWSSMPDDTLSAVADSGTINQDPAELGKQFARMFGDAKSDALLLNFSGQWLTTRAVDEVAPAKEVFPAFDEALRVTMRQETDMFFRALVRDAMPLETLLLADFTFADARLARHYGLTGGTAQLQKMSLTGTQRIGLLTQTSFLATTSFPERTSPVKRGGWVLEQLLCTPPPPVPAGVMAALPPATPGQQQTLRERLEQHRADPTCAACHALFDPIGFGLENFDAIGAYRAMDSGRAVDSSGVLGGKTFSGARELATIIAQDRRFAACAAEQLLTYAVGRSFRAQDAKLYAEGVAANARFAGGSWRHLLDAVVTSQAFVTRTADAP